MKWLARLLGVAVFSTTALAQAGVIIDLTKEFSGATAPSGTAPWLTAEFKDITTGSVELTLTSKLQDSDEFVVGWYFNFNPAKSINILSGIASTPVNFAWASPAISIGNDAYKADGDGFFDIKVEFDNAPPSNRFGGADVGTIVFTGSGIVAADFNNVSVNGPVGKNGFLSAAHIQGIGPSANDSGWIGDGDGGGGDDDIPEPASLGLLGLGLLAMGVVRRRKIIRS